ncbi:MAG: ASCH domain-containing protein [Desulfurococcaceae archaeon]
MSHISRRSRVKFIGRHLMMKGIYVEKLLKGVKRATIRRGIVKPRYREVIIHAGGKPVAKARIVRVYHGKLKELGEYEARVDGYESTEELIADLKRIYRGLSDDDAITVIEFRVTQKLEGPLVEGQYLESTPSDIAGLALRHLDKDLSDLEKKVLQDLARTGSIRKTAVNIFNDLSKRNLVRGILRKAVRLLSERGLNKKGNSAD